MHCFHIKIVLMKAVNYLVKKAKIISISINFIHRKKFLKSFLDRCDMRSTSDFTLLTFIEIFIEFVRSSSRLTGHSAK
jgi:hypothetical protein